MSDVLRADSGMILHGAVVFSRDRHTLESFEDAYVVCVNGICEGVYESIPDQYVNLPVEDFWDKLILPGFTDLHIHAPQYQFRGLGMDMELLPWLQNITYPEEGRYKNRRYAERAYDLFAEDLYIGPVTRAVIFATKHTASTLMLMDIMEETGLVTYVGKVNMDRNVPDYYIETTEGSLRATRKWLKEAAARNYRNTYPILTPRFTPSCTEKLMEGLGAIAKEYGLPVQSHLSESLSEMELVQSLEPGSEYYANTYDRCGLFGTAGKTVMAHCVWSVDEEIEKIKENGVFIAHCPDSNMNLTSGIAPAARYLDEGMNIGLGSDVGGGSNTSMFRQMRDAVTVSKMRSRLFEPEIRAITFPEAFYMATKGGGAFFGKAGSFETGYEFDAVVIDDSSIATLRELTAAERAERLAYLGDDRHVVGKYVRGRKIY